MSEKITKYLTPVVALFFATALGVTASSTIGTDITTGGNLDVTGNTTITGTLGVTGTTTLNSNVLFEGTSSEPVCDGGVAGAVRYANGDNQLCFCNGTGWFQVGDPAVGCTFNAS